MSDDVSALTEAVVAGLPEVQACLVVSLHGRVIAVAPAHEEVRALAAWNGLSGLGEVRRGMVTIGSEQWAFTVRADLGALALLRPTPRHGVILDRLDRLAGRARSLVRAAAPAASSEGVRSGDRWEGDTALIREFAGILSEFDEGYAR